ncbi:P-loop NTPase [Aeromonas hydrophila]|uniref:P-loop NTPase n=1 Tax=Aeromonas hydrophila TaxID=644 RepID=UPI002B4A33C8|nr:SIR2 family protein [Aeromonas hydrophila]
MPLDLLTKEELLTAALATKRPVAFLVGSPLSQKDGIGVPGVTEILEFVRAEIRDRVAFALPRFETALAGKTGGDAYQEAMKWLGKNAGQDAINDVIQTAVLKARKAGVGELPKGTDGQPDEWNIPLGTASLGEMVAGANERFLGPVLTTNFDPLISLAVRSAGGRSGRRVLTVDGTLAGAAEDEPGMCTVVHLHGYWRDSDTLHTQAQLTNPRQKLTKSLQRLLQRRTLIVAAYGGWDDVFTQALIELMNDEQAPLDVIWCFYESDADKVKAKYGKLLAAVEPATVMNRFRAFGGIDCHSIFGEILSTLRGMTPAVAVPSVVSPLAGWELVDAAYLRALPPLRPEEVVRYFDGATPTWRHATCPDIPSRAAVAEIGRCLVEARSSNAACSLQLIRAAGGEGKTTLLLQSAAAAANDGGWSVLWRTTPRVGLPSEHVRTLDPTKHWLIVADDAENLIHDLSEAARLLHEAGLSHVHFLLASRDTDWRHFHGDRQTWGTLLKQHPDILLRELRDDDANILIEAWRKYGNDGLRELATLSSPEQQIAALLTAVRGAALARDEGSFFGGLLAVRFGPDGLRNHVVALLTRLKEAQIANSNRSLFDALLYVAACHAVGISGINEKILADLLDVDCNWIQTLVVNPLGEEAAAIRSAGHVQTRHTKVASAILVAAEQDLGADIAEIWSAIVRQTVRTSLDVRVGETFTRIIHAGPRLQRELPRQFTEQRRKEIAVAAARAAELHQSAWLGCVVDLGKTYRNAGDFDAAVQVFRDNLPTAPNKVDFAEVIRGYWYEWGMAEGSTGNDATPHASDAWLQGLSLADHLKTAPITAEQAKLSCAGLGVAFGKLSEPLPDCPFARARRAAAYLGRLTTTDPKALGYFEKYDRDADKIDTPHPKNLEEAVGWLSAAVVQAGRELQDPFLKALLKPEQVSFNMLREFLNPAPPPRSRAKPYVPTPAPQASPMAEARYLLTQLSSNFEDRVKAGIERVLTQAWEAVPIATAEENRLSTAKRKATDIIKRLSPAIRKQVGSHFHAENWESLKSRDPRV